MFYASPQTRTEKRLIQMKLKATTRKRTRCISFFECCSSPLYLKGEYMYYKLLLTYGWSLNAKFPWLMRPKWAYRLLCADTGNCGGTTACERTWRRRKLIFFPLSPGPSALSLQTPSSTALRQHGSLLGSIFMASVPCCRTPLAPMSST